MSFLIIVLVIMLYGSDLWPDLILTELNSILAFKCLGSVRFTIYNTLQ